MAANGATTDHVNSGTLRSGGDLSVIAGDSLTLGDTTLRQASAVSGAHLSVSSSAVENYGTTISAGGNATLAALGGDLTAAGTTLTSSGDLVLSAAKSLDLGSVTNSASFSASGSKSGFLTHSSFSDSSSSTTEVGSSVAAGGSLTALAGGDLSVKGGRRGRWAMARGATRRPVRRRSGRRVSPVADCVDRR